MFCAGEEIVLSAINLWSTLYYTFGYSNWVELELLVFFCGCCGISTPIDGKLINFLFLQWIESLVCVVA